MIKFLRTSGSIDAIIPECETPYELFMVVEREEVIALGKTFGDLLIDAENDHRLALVTKGYEEAKIDKEAMRTGVIALIRHFKTLDDESPKTIIISRFQFKNPKEITLFEMMIKGTAGLIFSNEELEKFTVIVTDCEDGVEITEI